MMRAYFTLTKPGIIFGNAITAAAGFAFASQGAFNVQLFSAMLVGMALIIASACVFNNYLDRVADEKMARTRQRALVTGMIPIRHALIFGSCLGLLGFFLLLQFTNLLTAAIALLGFSIYVGVYSLLKHHTTHATWIGSLAGATPPVVGYCAVTHQLDFVALILFLIIVFWQMPHFYAIAMYRLNDYAAALIPVLPVKRGALITKIHMLAYIIAFALAALLLPHASTLYLSVTALLSGVWLYLCLKGFRTENNTLWAKQMFLFSLVIVTALSLTLSIG